MPTALPPARRRHLSAIDADDTVPSGGSGQMRSDWLGEGSVRRSTQQLDGPTRTMFERAGFAFDRAKGKKGCVMRTTVAPRRTPWAGLAVGICDQLPAVPRASFDDATFRSVASGLR